MKRLSSISRIGRAYGVHLVACTQRPDADVIPGQIKSNLGFRVCSQADSILSQIILGNGDADDRIAKDIPGRFLTNTGDLFQGSFLEPSTIVDSDFLVELPPQ